MLNSLLQGLVHIDDACTVRDRSNTYYKTNEIARPLT